MLLLLLLLLLLLPRLMLLLLLLLLVLVMLALLLKLLLLALVLLMMLLLLLLLPPPTRPPPPPPPPRSIDTPPQTAAPCDPILPRERLREVGTLTGLDDTLLPPPAAGEGGHLPPPPLPNLNQNPPLLARGPETHASRSSPFGSQGLREATVAALSRSLPFSSAHDEPPHPHPRCKLGSYVGSAAMVASPPVKHSTEFALTVWGGGDTVAARGWRNLEGDTVAMRGWRNLADVVAGVPVPLSPPP